MKLKLNFSNGTPAVNFEDNNIGYSTPLELSIQSVNQRKHIDATRLYVKALDYLFRGVANYSTGNITNISVEKGWFGKIEKNRDAIHWNAISDKSFVVIYDIAIDEITEHMYVADSIKAGNTNGKGSKQLGGANPTWIKELIAPDPKGVKENIISSIEIASEFIKDYRMAWGFNGVEGLSILDVNNNIIEEDSIASDEVYTLIKLLSLLRSKGIHMGVFFVDCRGFSDNILEAFASAAKVFFGDTYIFFYNVDPKSTVERKVISLPNFLEK